MLFKISAIKKIDTFSCIIYWNTKILATKAGVEEVQAKGEEATAESGKYEVVDVVGDMELLPLYKIWGSWRAGRQYFSMNYI